MLLPTHQIWGYFLGGVADVIQKSEDTHQNPNHNTKANQQKYLLDLGVHLTCYKRWVPTFDTKNWKTSYNR